MGKVRKSKSKANKNVPVDNNEQEEEALGDSKENAIHTILDQLQVSQKFFIKLFMYLFCRCLLFI